jgi:rubrerythrin
VKVWRCRICGDSYIGTRRPSTCPFCGAHEKFVLLARDWTLPVKEELSDPARRDLERTLEIELGKAAFYACAADKAGQGLDFAVFDALSREHAKHASIVRQMLGLAKPSTTGQGTCHDTTEANLKEALDRQKKAASLYAEIRDRTSEPKAKEIYQALVEIETDHLTLVEGLLTDILK